MISNTPYEFAYAKTKKVLRKRAGMGMGRHEFSKVAKAMSVNCQRFWCEREVDGCTVAKLRDNLRPNRLYVINVTDHYIVVDTRDWTVCDNFSAKWIPLADWPHRRTRCRATLDCTTTEIHWPDSNGKRYPIRMPMPI